MQEQNTVDKKYSQETRTETVLERDNNGRIVRYSYKIYNRDTAPTEGCLSRDEMVELFRMYSFYGDNFTQAIVARRFVDLSQDDIRNILRAFGIKKHTRPFPPHMVEELSEEELIEVENREKVNRAIRRAEVKFENSRERRVQKLTNENILLRRQLDDTKNINVRLETDRQPLYINYTIDSGQSINLYAADLHIGAVTNPESPYKENCDYGPEEIKRRLGEVVKRVSQLGQFKHVNIVLLGDSLDCCGKQNSTVRGGNYLPENLNPRQQYKTFMDAMLYFVDSIIANHIGEKIHIYTCPGGNHDGRAFGGTAHSAFLVAAKHAYPEITTEEWEEFFGVFKQDDETFICCHGRDDEFMKGHMPTVLNNRTHINLLNYIQSREIKGKIHVVKGDMHNGAISGCENFTYRSVLSLFGASDYANMNYVRAPYGMSYDIIKNGQLLRGDFANI